MEETSVLKLDNFWRGSDKANDHSNNLVDTYIHVCSLTDPLDERHFTTTTYTQHDHESADSNKIQI